MTGSSSGSGSGPGPSSGSRSIDPHRVYELVIRRKPRELLDYLDSIPGASGDLHCQGVELAGKALLHLVSKPLRPLSAEENRDIACWARLARFHATNSRFCAPQMVGNPSNLTSDAGRYMHPHNSSSYSGTMLTHAPDNLELIHSAASSSRTPAANPVQEIVYDVHRHAALHNPVSPSSSKILDAMLPPVKANPSSAAPERRGRAPPLRKSTSRPSGAATSPPPRAGTSSPRTPVRPRRCLLPLLTYQRQILSVPELEVEQATSAPPPRGRALRLRGIDLGRYRQPIEGGRITYLKDPESDPKKFFWAKALESWPDDDV